MRISQLAYGTGKRKTLLSELESRTEREFRKDAKGRSLQKTWIAGSMDVVGRLVLEG